MQSITLVLLGFGVLLLLPTVAFADNCSSPGDCWSTAESGAATAGGIAGLITGYVIAGGAKRPRGFVYNRDKSLSRRQTPSAKAPPVGKPIPPGSRLIYDDRVDRGGETWYRVKTTMGGESGWVRLSDVSDSRPTIPPAGPRIQIKDSGLGEVRVTASITASARG